MGHPHHIRNIIRTASETRVMSMTVMEVTRTIKRSHFIHIILHLIHNNHRHNQEEEGAIKVVWFQVNILVLYFSLLF